MTAPNERRSPPVPDLFAEAVRRAKHPPKGAPKPRQAMGPRRPRAADATGAPRKPAPALVPLEKAEQALLFRWAAVMACAHPALQELFAVPNAGGYVGGFANNLRRVQAMKREGLKKGVPDICLPHARGGYHALYLELKRTTATPSDTTAEQRDWHQRLRAAGNRVVVCNGAEAAQTALLEYLALPLSPNPGATDEQP